MENLNMRYYKQTTLFRMFVLLLFLLYRSQNIKIIKVAVKSNKMSFTIVTLLNIILSDQWCVLPQYSSGLWFHSFYVSKFQISSVHVRDGRHRTIVVNIAFLSSQFYLSVWYMAYELLNLRSPLRIWKKTQNVSTRVDVNTCFCFTFFIFLQTHTYVTSQLAVSLISVTCTTPGAGSPH